MISEKIKELEATKAKIASLEKSIASELHAELRALPAKFGYDSAAAFVQRSRPRRAVGARSGAESPAAASASARRSPTRRAPT